jgi:RecA/RadA recombinase
MLMGTQARLSNKAMRKWVSSLNAMHRLPTLLVINQIRMKIGVMYGDPETTPGGMGKEFASSLDIRMRRGKYHFLSAKGTDVTTSDGTADPLYADIHFLVKKNKVGAPGKGGEFRFYLSNHDGRSIGDSDDSETIWSFAKKYGLVVSGDGKWTCGELEAATWKELKVIVKMPANLQRVRGELLAILARK